MTVITLADVVLFVHILGASIWVGGTVALGIVAVAVRSSLGDDPALYARTMSRIARSLGWMMWGALGVTIATGLYNLTWFLGPTGMAGVSSIPWLVVKLLLVLFLVLVSAFHSFVLGPEIRRRSERGARNPSLQKWRSFDRALTGISAVLTVAVLFAAVMLAS